jgi:hypothetical protein
MAEKKDAYSKQIPIDSIGLLEIDKAVHNWFDVKHPVVFHGRKVPSIFGAWERFAQIQGNSNEDSINKIRDQKGAVKLPLIALRRGDVQPDPNRYLNKTLEGQDQIVFHKEIALSKFEKEQRVPFSKKWKAGSRYITSEPVYETYSLPFPTFVTIPYTITFWSSYVGQTIDFHNMIWSKYHFPDIEYNGFFFYSDVDGSSDESNTEDFSTDRRILRHSFNLNVQGYLINKSEIKVDRTVSRFSFEENIIEAEDGIDMLVSNVSSQTPL